MNCDAAAPAGGLIDGSFQLGGGVLIWGMQYAVAHSVRAGLVNFCEIRTLFVLLAQRRNDFIHSVGIGCIRQDMLHRIESIGILMPAENVDGIAADSQPRSRNRASVDGV